MSQLERLPNELLFDVLEFLSTADLLHAFLDLNSRFNQLLFIHFQNHQFNFQSISKQHFDRICSQHYSNLDNRIISLHLTNDDETPNLCEFFLTSGLTLDQFIHLKSLTLSHIDSFHTTNQLIVQCRSLPSLENVSFIDCQSLNQQDKHTVALINNIWSLPNLIHCVMNNVQVKITWIHQISTINSTLEYLSIQMIEGDKSGLYYLCKSAPRLQQLHVDMIHWSFYNQPMIVFPSLVSLRAAFRGAIEPTIGFLKNLPNLSSLTFEIDDDTFDGNDWQYLLANYLPKLRIFRLKMNFICPTYPSLIDAVDEFVDSFRTSFWIEEHRWFVRCDCYLWNNKYYAILYTLPSTFKQCSYSNTYYSISSKSDDDERHSHRFVQVVDQQFIQLDSLQNLKLFHLRFPNIRQMEIIFPFSDYFNHLGHLLFQQLTSLTVMLNNQLSYHQLQTFLCRTPQLYSVKFLSFGGSIDGFFQLTSSSIRRLDLLIAQSRHELIFRDDNRLNLINSPLGRQCEVLLIELENANDILELVEKMSHLRVLICRLKNDIKTFNHWRFSLKSYRLIQWLKDHLPSNCSITVNSDQRPQISLWISREINQSSSLDDRTSISNDSAHRREHFNLACLCLFLFSLVSCFLLIYFFVKI